MAPNPHHAFPTALPGQLVLVRHAESEWNMLGKWTGRTDVHLSQKGQHDAGLLGEKLRDLAFDHAYHSEQVRTLETLQELLRSANQAQVPLTSSSALNERDYGEYTGMNKWDVREQLGQDVFDNIRRSWNYPIPQGETLRMVYDRAVPFYQTKLLPKLAAGDTILVVSHGNTLRTMLKYLEDISDQAIANVEMPFDHILLFSVDVEGRSVHKEQRIIEITDTPA